MSSSKASLYTVSSVSGAGRVLVKEYPIVKEDPDTFWLEFGVGSDAYPVKKDSLYLCQNIFRDTMFGADPKVLREAWDKCVKASAIKALKKFDALLFSKLSSSRAASAASETSTVPSQSKSEPPTQEIAALLRAPERPDKGCGYPMACNLTWGRIESLLALWAAKNFNAESNAVISTFREDYSEESEGWYIAFSGLIAEDRPAVVAILEKHDTAKIIKLNKEWTEGFPPPGGTLTLSNTISNHIMGTEVLPIETPPFKHGVERSIATVGEVLFFSAYDF